VTQRKQPVLISPRTFLPQLLGIAGEAIAPGEAEETDTLVREFVVERKIVLRPDGINPLPVFYHSPRQGEVKGAMVLLSRADAGHGTYAVTLEVRRSLGHWLAEHGWAVIAPVFAGFEEREFPLNHKTTYMDPWGRGIRDLLLTGKTLTGQIVLDVLRVLKHFRGQETLRDKPMGVVGFQGLNLATICSGLLDSEVDFLACFRCLGDYRDRIEQHVFDTWAEYVPNLLKFADLSDLGGAVAPRPMFLSRSDDLLAPTMVLPFFKKVRRAYIQAGVEKALCLQTVGRGKFLTGEAIREFGQWLTGLKLPHRQKPSTVSLGNRLKCQPIGTKVEKLATWNRERGRAMKVFEDLTGGFPHRPVDPEARIIETMENQYFIRQTLTYRVASGERTAAEFYLPHDMKKPAPTVLGIHCHGGHYWEGRVCQKDESWVTDFVRAGFPVFIHDHFGFGDRRIDNAISSGPRNDWFEIAGMYQAMRGETVAGILVRDLMSAIDYLQTRPEVDADRIGATGYSMGGGLTVLAAVFDERIKAVVSCVGHYHLGTLIAHRSSMLNSHGLIPGQLRYFDNDVVAALVAPRPLLLCHSRQDGGTEEEGPRIIAEYCRKIYRLYGKADQFGILGPEGPHDYLPVFREAGIDWFRRFL